MGIDRFLSFAEPVFRGEGQSENVLTNALKTIKTIIQTADILLQGIISWVSN
jgi:hypothetical protein